MAKTKLAILDDYDGSIARLPCWKQLEGDFETTFFREPQPAARFGAFEALVTVRERTIVNKEFLSCTPNLKHLAVTGRLSGQADLEELSRRKIAASFTDGSGPAAAELTIGLIASAVKGIPTRHQEMASGGWQIGPGQSLAGKTLGVLGLGRVGQKVALFGKLMDMRVISWGPTPDAGRSEKFGIERLNLDEVLRQADVISINLRLSEKTRGLLGLDHFALLKSGALLVNTARAEITDHDALYSALASGRIRAALDVFHEEPLPKNDPLRKFPNVLLSPHMGYVTNEVYEIFFTQVVENLLHWKAGAPYRSALA